MRCLVIDELYIEVLDHVYDDGRDRRSVLAMALVCRLFSIQAKKRLWKDLPSIAPLFALLLHPGTIDNHLYPGAAVLDDLTVRRERDLWEKSR